MTSAQAPQELLTVVDDQEDQQLGLEPRWRIHRDGLKHRAVHMPLFDSRGRFYLQQRSLAKDTHPGQWTSSAGGHVDPGEDYHPAAAARELAEELGLEAELTPLGVIPAQEATGGRSSVPCSRPWQARRPGPTPWRSARAAFSLLVRPWPTTPARPYPDSSSSWP